MDQVVFRSFRWRSDRLYLDWLIDGDRQRRIVRTPRSLKVGFEWCDKGRQSRDRIRMGVPPTRDENITVVKHDDSQLTGRVGVSRGIRFDLRIVNVHITASRKQVHRRERERER